MGNFLGVGIRFPFGVDNRKSVAFSKYEEDVEQSILVILGTAKGERQMRPDFGCGIHDYVFAPNNTSTHTLVAHEVEEALVKWEPRVKDVKAEVNADPERPNRLLVDCSYVIRSTNSVFNLVYPFYLQGS